MSAVQCPIPGCEYVTDDLDAAIVAALITAHSVAHAPGPVTAAKVEKVKRPIISAAGTSEEWAYFASRWSEYVDATKITGRDKVVQLLECCDEQLRKELTRSAVGSLTNKTDIEYYNQILEVSGQELKGNYVSYIYLDASAANLGTWVDDILQSSLYDVINKSMHLKCRAHCETRGVVDGYYKICIMGHSGYTNIAIYVFDRDGTYWLSGFQPSNTVFDREILSSADAFYQGY